MLNKNIFQQYTNVSVLVWCNCKHLAYNNSQSSEEIFNLSILVCLTNLDPAILLAFQQIEAVKEAVSENAKKLVIFLTDGHVAYRQRAIDTIAFVISILGFRFTDWLSVSAPISV